MFGLFSVVIVLSRQQIAQGGTAQVSNPNLIATIEVDSVEHLHQHDPPFEEQESLLKQQEPSSKYLSMRQITDRMDTVYALSYVPKGFVLVGRTITQFKLVTRQMGSTIGIAWRCIVAARWLLRNVGSSSRLLENRACRSA